MGTFRTAMKLGGEMVLHMLDPRWTILLFLMLLTSAAGQAALLSAPDVTLWLSWPSTSKNDIFFDTVQREFAPGGESTHGGSVVPAADAINKMPTCDYTAEATFLNRVLAASGTRLLIAKPCPGATNKALWVTIAGNDGIGPMLYTLSGDASEYPPDMVFEGSKWLAFAPDNELGGFYMGMAACDSSGPNMNMPIVFMRGPADEPQVWCDQILAGFQRGLDTCPNHYNFLATVVNTTAVASKSDGWDLKAGKKAFSKAMLTNPKIMGVAACADALAAGAIRYWTTFNNGGFAAGLFVSSFGANTEYSELVAQGKIKLTIDPLISTEGAGVVRAVKFASLGFLQEKVDADLHLVVSPVVQRGKYLKQSLKKTVLQTYDKTLRPDDGGEADVFTLNVDFTSISSVKFAERTFEASGWIHMTWKDERAVWNAAIYSLFPGLMSWDVSQIYKPEFIWPNRIDNMIDAPQKIVKSDGVGNFAYLEEFRGKFSCSMSLSAYPVDVQECSIRIASREPTEAIVLSASKVLCGPETTGEYYIKYMNRTNVAVYNNDGGTGAYSEATFDILFKHDPMPFVFSVIIPCVMLFLVGYSSFFLTAEPARAAFSIICLLTTVGVNKQGRDMVPAHVGTTWVDQWLLIHLSFAFITLVECVVSYHPKLQLAKPTPPAPKPVPNVESNPIGPDMADDGMSGWGLAAVNEDKKAPGRKKTRKKRDHDEEAGPMECIEIVHLSPRSQPENLAVGEEGPFELSKLALGPVMISKNYVDLIMQRVYPIVYFLCVFIMLAMLSGQAQDYGNGVYQPPLKCANTMRLLNNVTAR